MMIEGNLWGLEISNDIFYLVDIILEYKIS